MAPASVTPKILKEEKIAEKVAAQGEWLKAKLADMQKRYPVAVTWWSWTVRLMPAVGTWVSVRW